MLLQTRLFLVLYFNIVYIYGNVFDECNNIIEQKFIASTKGCTYYIFCNGEESFDGECGEGDFFSPELEMCEPIEAVDCHIANSTALINNNTSTDLPMTTSTAPEFSTIILVEAATVTPYTNISFSTENTTVNAETTSSLSVHTIILTECPSTDNPSKIVFMVNFKSCSDYFMCYKGLPLLMSCPSMLHFNPRTLKCDHAENVQCINKFATIKEQCQPHTVDLFPYPSNCNYFYLCRNGYLMLQQCPYMFGWNYVKRSCVLLSQAKCNRSVKDLL